MRFRKDVKSGDVVVKNKGGWMVPLVVSSQPIGEVSCVYRDGEAIPFGIIHSITGSNSVVCEVKLF